ncbi:uncharacterized protein LOC141649145 [Silene latifolia]|uniref:uncharacterized protein LOC141649145 n=1 Tax=Silene latifolia TaxID=37657 RepID=UPI003D76C038
MAIDRSGKLFELSFPLSLAMTKIKLLLLRFKNGLTTSIKKRLADGQPSTMDVVYQRAGHAERIADMFREERREKEEKKGKSEKRKDESSSENVGSKKQNSNQYHSYFANSAPMGGVSRESDVQSVGSNRNAGQWSTQRSYNNKQGNGGDQSNGGKTFGIASTVQGNGEKAALSKIASYVGKPICADELTTSKSKIAFARILVEVDLSKELPKGMKLQTPYRGTILQKIDYEWLPYFCHTCKKIGHTKDRCAKNKVKQAYKPKQQEVAPVAPPPQSDKPTSPVLVTTIVSPPTQPRRKSGGLVADPVISCLENKYSALADSEEPVLVQLDVDQGRVHLEFLQVQVVEIDLGDFNITLNSDEKLGCVIHEREIQEFRDCLDICGLSDHFYTGGNYTWHYKQASSPRWAKLDRLLVNSQWSLNIPTSTVVFLPAGVSDHAPMVMKIPSAGSPPRPFKYLNCWALSNGFHSMVSQNWNIGTNGGRIYSLFSKLRSLRRHLKALHIGEFSGITRRVTEAKAKLLACQLDLQLSPLDCSLLIQEKELLNSYVNITARKTSNTIGTIKDAQRNWCTRQQEVSTAFLSYYQTLLGASEKVGKLSPNLFTTHTLVDVSHLEAPVISQEIEAALFSIDRHKSPGVDGYSSGFFRDIWDIIGTDFQDAVQEVFRSGHIPRAANSTLIALIPKVSSSSSVTEFRPISCCTVFYKTVSKILANRMKTVLSTIVGLEQAAFIEGRDLFDYSMLAHELASKYNRSLITPRCLLKVDIKKAFDSVNLDFLASCLNMFGFPPKFAKWVLACVTSSHFSLSINGFSTGFFPGKQGLRQGDPLTPYLFVLCMEVLSRLLRKLPSHPGFSYHPKCVQVNLTHLVFADDLLVFTRGDLPSVLAVANCLKTFSIISVLQVNPMKSNLYFGGVSKSVKDMILTSTGLVEGDLPVRYLGIPLFSSRLTHKMFQPMLDKIKDKISYWANHMLSYAGKVTLINSVIFGLHNFWGASVLLPKGVAKRINQMCKDFLWGIKDGDRRLVFKSWVSFCRPHNEGGINIKEVLSWNKSQMLVWMRKIVTDAPNIWVKWVKAYILKGVTIWDFQLTAAYSWSRDILIQATGDRDVAYSLLQCPDYKQQFYDLIREKGPAYSQYKTPWDTFNYPKNTVIGLLAVENKLSTLDNLCGRGMVLVSRCALCERHAETAQHLFFECDYSASIWLAISDWLGITYSFKLHAIFSWFRTHNRGRSLLK